MLFVTKVATKRNTKYNILTLVAEIKESHYGLLQFAKHINPHILHTEEELTRDFSSYSMVYIDETPRPPMITRKSRALD